MHEENPVPQVPSLVTKAFTVVGFFIAISCIAYFIAEIVTTINERHDLKWSIFFVFWGLLARFFQWTARRGMETSLAKKSDEDDFHILGEQVWAMSFFKRIIEVELIVSFVWLLSRLRS